ncbi:MAG: MFS transporter [Candidatus Bathyarchaeia archaeon]
MRKSSVLFVTTLSTLSTLGVGLLGPVYPIFIINRFSASAVDLGVLYAIFCVTTAVFKVVAGKLVDSFGKSKVFFVGVAIGAICSLSYIFALNIIQLYLIEFFYGLSYALQRPALLALMFDVSNTCNRGLFLGLFESIYDFTEAFAAVFSVIIVSKFGFEPLFLMCSGCQATTGILILRAENKPFLKH